MISYVNKPVNHDRPQEYYKDYQRSQDLKSIITSFVWSPIIFDGGRRGQVNFIESHWAVVDIDGGWSLDAAIKCLQGSAHIIGTTRSHRVAKGQKPACDRFRICVPWSEPIRDIELYRFNLALCIEGCGSDMQCSDGARFFWPCTEIISYSDSGNKQTVNFNMPEKPKEIPFKTQVEWARQHGKGYMPGYVAKFLASGALFGREDRRGREYCCYCSALEMLKYGWAEDEILQALTSSPFPRENFDDSKEIPHAVNQAVKKFIQLGGSIDE